MSKKALKERVITIPQVKEMLESIGEEYLDQFQRRSLDYAAKFSKVDTKTAEELVNQLTEGFGVEDEEAVQIVNCMPESIHELWTILAAGRRIVQTAKLREILVLLNKHRKGK